MSVKNVSSHPVVQSFLKTYDLTPKWMGWGYKGSGLYAKKKAEKRGGDLYLFEDAPIRSLRPGYEGAVYGITVDRKGAMFDATGHSTLVDRLNHADIKISSEVPSLMETITREGISKYNWGLPASKGTLNGYPRGVLLVDQTRGDAALKYAGVDKKTFQQMAEDALRETPDGMPIYLKSHPNQYLREKKSCFSAEILSHPRIMVLPPELRVADCMTFCEKIYVASSLVGMEALLYGETVITYGWNFYAGWGLTEDRGEDCDAPRRRTLTLEEMFQAYYLDYSYYADPDTGRETELGQILDHIQFQVKSWRTWAGNYHFTSHLSPWHKHILRKTLSAPSIDLDEKKGAGTHGLAWGMRAGSLQEGVYQVEDGFIRSRGLGAQFHYPLSLVMDYRGIYFNAQQASTLEEILNEAEWTEDELKEGEKLWEYLVTHHITKYLLQHEPDKDILPRAAVEAQSRGRKVILIPGQVDTDASIQFGSPEFKTNKDFLLHIRVRFPDAYIIYKPHPDLLTRSRKGSPKWRGIEKQCDYIATKGDIIAWIEAVDEIHTLTSTTGFEALMHAKPVFTYGLPFYAGWGLTTDEHSTERRKRRCTTLELVTAVLIKYPMYANPRTGEFISALRAASLLNDPSFHPPEPPKSLQWLSRLKQFKNRITP